VKLDQLIAVGPVQPSIAARFIGPLQVAMARFKINTPEREALFIAQVLHESLNLTRMVENLNYRPDVLVDKFRGRFSRQQADEYGYVPGVKQADQRMIANIAYGSRMGNGPIHSDEGWRYRGRGPIQLTGKDNYRLCGAAIGLDLVRSPELLEQPGPGCLAAGWFWDVGNRLGHSLNALADAGEVGAISRAINGGDNGLIERRNLAQRALKELTCVA
jgi:putative chitinase